MRNIFRPCSAVQKWIKIKQKGGEVRRRKGEELHKEL
jgi:hypothetical protein